MNGLKSIIFSKIIIVLGCFYHLWYYTLMLVGIISLSPWLYFSSRKSQYFPKFYGYARLWSAWILNGMFLSRKIKREAEIQWDKPYVVVSNHASELDVMLCYQLVCESFPAMTTWAHRVRRE